MLQEFLVHSRDSTQFYLWDPSELRFSFCSGIAWGQTILGREDSNVPIFSRFLQMARLVHHCDPRELTVGFEGLNCVVIGSPTAYGVFWLRLRDSLFIVSQSVGSDELS